MVDDTQSEATSYVRNQEAITVLSQPISSSATTLVLDDASQVSRGMVEIGDELVYIKSVNKTTGTADVMPGGRGWRGTTAAAHDAHTVVRNNPIFPRALIKRALNDTIRGIDLKAIGSYQFVFDGVQYAYPLPVDFRDAVGVTWHAPNTTQVWPLLKHFRIDRNWRTESDAATVRPALVLIEYPMPGREVRVQYTKFPTALSDGDDFSDTGLPASAEDVIRLGAMWRMVTTVDPGKVIAMAPSADVIDQPVAAGQSTNVAKYLYQLFSVRLAEEKAKQADLYTSIITYAR